MISAWQRLLQALVFTFAIHHVVATELQSEQQSGNGNVAGSQHSHQRDTGSYAIRHDGKAVADSNKHRHHRLSRSEKEALRRVEEAVYSAMRHNDDAGNDAQQADEAQQAGEADDAQQAGVHVQQAGEVDDVQQAGVHVAINDDTKDAQEVKITKRDRDKDFVPVKTTLKHDGRSVVLMSKADLQTMEEKLEGVLSAEKEKLQKSVDQVYKLQENAMKAKVKRLHRAFDVFMKDSSSRLALLQAQAQRFRVGVHHGIYGRCCCRGRHVSDQECKWTSTLVGEINRNCPRDWADYREHKVPGSDGAARQAGQLDILLDACAKSQGWQEHAKGSHGFADMGPSKQALKAVEEIMSMDEADIDA
eukprot:gnl/TRDRNA2_/TRDRNA2_180380_c0_seq1.p1 gnl/TRDRNA2_/TRDRNA2_180380_c0~~gnl/TRDRNA2_/TRDRNA2_180380_c0_seq1.p1  ORF type:complete len:361 (+),score=82.76 gnl/TRDRNA2_/TRDRNA2_180380_c0_seq1:103-1185(+)